MATINFQDLRALSVFRGVAEMRRNVTSHDDNEAQLYNALEGLIATIGSVTRVSPPSFSLELDDEEAEAARDVLWHCLNTSRDLDGDSETTSGEYVFPGQIVIDPEEAPDPLVTQITLTDREVKIITRVLLDAADGKNSALTADVAVDLLEKLRLADFR